MRSTNGKGDVIALIPALNPTEDLIEVAKELHGSGFSSVVVIDDGSTKPSQPVFDMLETLPFITVLRHAVNLGKGAALRTGLNHIYCGFSKSIGVVSVDSDGQHQPKDAARVADALRSSPSDLILGARTLRHDVPTRSKFGNSLTCTLFKLLIGQRITDTQTGMRGIPRNFIPRLLRIEARGYEFELDMLFICKQSGLSIREVPIETIYIDNNRVSHFNPILDSMRIYFVLFRFTLAALSTALIDYLIFLLVYVVGHNLIASQVIARVVAMFYNYFLVRSVVFYSKDRIRRTFPKYALLVLVSGTVSYLFIRLLSTYADLPVMPSKVAAETLIFLANFAIQRDFIFTGTGAEKTTDWDRYYSRPYKTAVLSRKTTQRVLAVRKQ